MKLHYTQLPREVLVGENSIAQLGETCRRLNFAKSALVVTGPKTFEVAGKASLDSLARADIGAEYVLVERSTADAVKLVEESINVSWPSVVIGLGGGKDIDVSKLASARAKLNFISVPTTASHDGIASPFASIKGLDGPYSILAQAPIAIIADTAIIGRSPYRLMASGCGDIVGKYTAVRDWRLGHKLKNEYYGDYAANLALMSAKLVMKNSELIRARSQEGIRTVVEALISCGVAMSIVGSSRPCSGSEHLFAHSLDRAVPNKTLHGETVGVGTILCAYLHGANWKLIKRVLKRIGAPTTAAELGVSSQDVVDALSSAHRIRPERYTILGETGITREAAEKVGRATGVIE